VVGALDPGAIVSLEVRSYVETLVQRGQIDFGAQAVPAAAAAAPKAGKTAKKAKAKKAAAARPKKAKAATKKSKAARTRSRKAGRRGAGFVAWRGRPTHVLKRIGNEIVLERVSFTCGCHPARFGCVSA
jgi:hypothetical protein